MDLLATKRDGAVAEATRVRNQVHQLLLQLDPEYKSHVPSLKSEAGLNALLADNAPVGGSVVQPQRAEAVRWLARRRGSVGVVLERRPMFSNNSTLPL